MSRVAKNPIPVPAGVEVKLDGGAVSIKGPMGAMSHPVTGLVSVTLDNGVLQVAANSESRESRAMSGTTRALLANMVLGVSKGFETRLSLVGVGFRAQAQGTKLNLQVGLSHPVVKEMPEGVKVATPTQTEIVISGADRQKVGQVAAEVRAFRPPEPYKGKGIRYLGERVVLKETKKK